jgi:hypothetical protein
MATGRVPTTANSPLTAKGDLFGYSTAPARLAVGNDGEQIVADSSTSTGLRYQCNYAAGKNKIINGDFGVWQRGTTLNLTAGVSSFLADRWLNYMDTNAATVTYSQQTFTPGTAPVAGYEGSFFGRLSTGGNGNFSMFAQKIEDVRTFAGQTVTVSFWMKTSAAKTFSVLLRQDFGSGGSSIVDQLSSYTTTTSWARYSLTFNLASISGKTIGTNSNLLLQLASYSAQTGNFTVDVWGVQVEAGSVATAFQTATGTIQGEYAACRRYYRRTSANGTNQYSVVAQGSASNTTNGAMMVPFDVSMRIAPTVVDYSTLRLADGVGAWTITAVAIDTNLISADYGFINCTVASGLTQYRPLFIQCNASASAYLGFSAEL